MLESIHIQGFKGVTDTTIGPLRKVNLIVGGQNVGKTSLLEAVVIGWTGSTGSAFRPSEGGDQGRFGKNALGNKFLAIEIKITGQDVLGLRGQNGQLAFLSGSPGPAPAPVPIPLYLPQQNTLVNLFGEVVVARKKRELTELLQGVEPRLLSLDAVSPDGEQRIYAEIEGIAQAVPLPELGHGFARLLYLFCTLLSTEAKLALIDEVESGIHYSALPTLLHGIKNVAHVRDVQTVMTTHSWDCIRAACEVFTDSPDDFQVIRLERTENNIQAVCIDGERMQRLMSEDREVR
jgi:hypothetical protein